LFKFGTPGSADGQLGQLHDLDLDSAGNIWVVDIGNQRLQKFNSIGTFLMKIDNGFCDISNPSNPACNTLAPGAIEDGDGQFFSPKSLAIDSSGNIWVADTNNNRLQKFDSSGTFLMKFGSTGSGNGQFDNANSIAIDSSGNLYVSDHNNRRVQIFDSSGNFLSQFGSFGTGDGEFINTHYVAIDSFDRIYVGDRERPVVQIFDSSGNFITKFGSFSDAKDIAIDNSGKIYVVDNHQAWVFSQTPTILSPTGQATGLTTILGTCGLSFPDGNTVDYGALLPNTISSEVALNMTNSGSVTALLEVRGTDWQDSSNNSVMFVNNTHYNTTSSQPFASNTNLETFDQITNSTFVPGFVLETFWQLETILLNPSFTGTASQTMDFTVSC